MLIKIPKLLDLVNIDVISDYRILVMNPITIKDRLDQEVNWLSTNSVINQPLKADHHAILKMRALVVAVEKTTCHFEVGEVTIAEAIHLANKKIQTYNKYLVDVPFNWTPFVVPVIPEQPMGDRTATGGDLFDLGCIWVDEVAKKHVIEPVKGGAENLGAVVEGILKLHMYELERRLKRPLLSFA
ncbi:hypothetical protein BC941DRAFT_250903 [Chlamydoabsidia padenii]|nr:hypothetical protein BC941DRAFT_250903 [Chlamydoabsidia padenii]